jgi:FlaA1/EpsC-like NDP-sugar epimerase/UDP-N-acetylmuramyl pentapeptide phosphotransferase/UDP-N-acetylglucosamine-1-phosphate transferase
MWSSGVGIGVIASILSYVCVGWYRTWAEKWRILDFPNERSSHTLPTARGGGLVIVALTLIGIWGLWAVFGPWSQSGVLSIYTLGAVVVAGVSLLDDLRTLPNWMKFIAHSLGALSVIAGFGYWDTLTLPIIGTLHLGWAGTVITFLWIVGVTNAYNFMDGIDGIAAGQGVIAGLGWAVIGGVNGQSVVGFLGVLIAATSLGFLGHNWPPARVFMGDVGSAFLGYTFAALPLMFTGRTVGPGTTAPLMWAILLIWPFLFDTGYTLLRRLIKGENILIAHRSHLYQRLVAVGHTHGLVTILYVLLAIAGALAAQVWSPVAVVENMVVVAILPFFGIALLVAVWESERRHAVRHAEIPAPFLRYRRVVIVLFQLCLLAISYYLSFLLRFDFNLNSPYRRAFLLTLPFVLLVKLPVFYYFRLLAGWWRYVGMSDLLDIIKAAGVSAPLVFGAVYWVHGLVGYPRSIFIVDPILTVFVVGGTRFAVRAYYESARLHLTHANTLIVGAGRAGSGIARELRGNERLEYNLVGFVDDDPTKKGVRVEGIKVLGSTDELPRLIEDNDVAHILIAIPSATGKQMQAIIEKCRQCKVAFKTLPAIGDIIRGVASATAVRNLRVEDLLARAPVRLDLGSIRTKFQGKPILITGAGGSIGSELSRQIADFRPSKLVLFDQGESDLFDIELELRRKFPALKCDAAIGDILDVKRLREIFAEHRPQSVFHAAAYKHVPLMEQNCFQAVKNNIFGTYNVALMARQYEAGDFVMISSDKAVNPSNVMGVTKRVAELLILGLQHHQTRFVSVRFGNVLGSRGSVLPVFQQQIAARSPITITDPEARRYFMTIPEAVQLVLQASTMGKGGEIFVLDMGEPVKIVDLARTLLTLSGLEPDRDVKIVFTGLRPGEKLFEELKLDGEGIKPTSHQKIRVWDGGAVSFKQVQTWLEELARLTEAHNVHGLVTKLKEIVPEYTPSPEILARSEVDRYDSFVSYEQAGTDRKE